MKRTSRIGRVGRWAAVLLLFLLGTFSCGGQKEAPNEEAAPVAEPAAAAVDEEKPADEAAPAADEEKPADEAAAADEEKAADESAGAAAEPSEESPAAEPAE